MTDQNWDSHLPLPYQSLSHYQWTPIQIVELTWEYLQKQTIRSVVDLGSGVGKFCLHLATLSKGRFPIVGIEDRSDLFTVSETLREKWNLSSVSFLNQSFLEDFPLGHSHYYAFNPLYETMKASFSIDMQKEKSALLFLQSVQILKNHLFRCKVGTKLITYHGFGGSVLPGYQLVLKKELEMGEWAVWERVV
ncbi:methyltransferase [Leptospira sp. WS60.C2]